MRAVRGLSLFAVAVTVAGCAAAASEAGSTFGAADSAGVRASADKWVSSILAKDYEAWATTVSPTVVLYPPNTKTIVGRSAATEYIKAYPPISKFQIEVDEQWGSGDVAYDRGKYTLTATLPNGIVVNDTGVFLSIFRRQPDSTWAHDRVMWNSSLPLPTPPAPTSTKRR
jgi:ketosteroid isomerase-like protein